MFRVLNTAAKGWVNSTVLERISLYISFRNVSLRQKVKALKKKEAEETKALEEMVLKVESNLEATTVRIEDIVCIYMCVYVEGTGGGVSRCG